MYAALEQPKKRVSSLEQAVACFAGGGAVYLQARALASLAKSHQDLGDDDDARTAWSQLEQLYEEMALPDEDHIYRPADLSYCNGN